MGLSAFTTRVQEATVSAREVLLAARKLIEDPQNWCCGQPYYPQECALTAVVHAGGSLKNETPGGAYEILCRLAGVTSLAAWNDTHSHADVLALFDRAIEEAA